MCVIIFLEGYYANIKQVNYNFTEYRQDNTNTLYLCKTKNFHLISGVTHGEELRSLQHYPMLLPPIIDGEDRIVSDKLISMWYNFVATR